MKISVSKLLVIISLNMFLGCQDKEKEPKKQKEQPSIQYQYDQDLDLIPDAIDPEMDVSLKSLPNFVIKKMQLKLINHQIVIDEPSQWVGLIKNSLGELNPGTLINHPSIFIYTHSRELQQIVFEYNFYDQTEGINILDGRFICVHKEIILNCTHDENNKSITIDLPNDHTYKNIKIYYTDYIIQRTNPSLMLTDKQYFNYIETSPYLKLLNFQNIYSPIVDYSRSSLSILLQKNNFGPYENIDIISSDESMAIAHGNPSLHFKQINNEIIAQIPSTLQNAELVNSVQNESQNFEIEKNVNHAIYLNFLGTNKIYQQKVIRTPDENPTLAQGKLHHFSQRLSQTEQMTIETILSQLEIFHSGSWYALKNLSDKIHIISDKSIVLNINTDKVILRLKRRHRSHWVGIFNEIENIMRQRGNRHLNRLLETHKLNYPTETHLSLEYFLF